MTDGAQSRGLNGHKGPCGADLVKKTILTIDETLTITFPPPEAFTAGTESSSQQRAPVRQWGLFLAPYTPLSHAFRPGFMPFVWRIGSSWPLVLGSGHSDTSSVYCIEGWEGSSWLMKLCWIFHYLIMIEIIWNKGWNVLGLPGVDFSL